MPITLNKPAGLPVFPPHAEPEGDCLLARLLKDEPHRGAIDWPKGFEGGIAHRLDNSTSGAILVANDLDELEQIREHFREHRFTKRYLLLAAKEVAWKLNSCDAAIAHDPRRKSRMVVERGKSTPHRGKWYPARTTFERVKSQLFRATMTSGVTHQIRVHAAFLGIPILGDKLYGGGSSTDGLFHLHHEGLRGPGDLATKKIPAPAWASINLENI